MYFADKYFSEHCIFFKNKTFKFYKIILSLRKVGKNRGKMRLT